MVGKNLGSLNYGEHLAAMVTGLRNAFANSQDFTFYSVQLASHSGVISGDTTIAQWWPLTGTIRTEQLRVTDLIENAYAIPTYDLSSVGEDPAHPFDKRNVGYRAADIALAVEYGKIEKETALFPKPVSIKWDNGYADILFEAVGDGLTSGTSNVAGFRCDGAKLVNVEIIGKDTVRVTFNGACSAIHYATEVNAASAGLKKSTGAPALAFTVKNENNENFAFRFTADSDCYVMSNPAYFMGLTERCTVSFALANLQEDASNYRIKSAEGNVLRGSDLVKTGSVIEALENGAVIGSATIIIIGDVNGDGVVSSADYQRIKRCFERKYQLDATALFAADLDESGRLSTVDYMRIKSYMAKTYDMYKEYYNLNG